MTDTLALAACILALIAAFAVLVCVKPPIRYVVLRPTIKITEDMIDYGKSPISYALAAVEMRKKLDEAIYRQMCVPSELFGLTRPEIIGDPKQPSGMHTL